MVTRRTATDSYVEYEFEVTWKVANTAPRCDQHRLMVRGGHGIPKALIGSAMLYLSTPL
jgi:hypothetical protein